MTENCRFDLIKSRFSLLAINRIYGNIPKFSFLSKRKNDRAQNQNIVQADIFYQVFWRF